MLPTQSQNTTSSIPAFCRIALLSCLLSVTGCEYLPIKKKAAAPTPPPRPQAIRPSASPIWASKADRTFAQTALKRLGYKVGPIDGIWGPRSATAIKRFESDFSLNSADGKLSNLNLTTLERASKLRRASFRDKKQAPLSIQALLAKQAPLTEGPQLIITERSYNILAKANPYSELVAAITPGTGVFIINLQQGWYEVESTNRERGYINAN